MNFPLENPLILLLIPLGIFVISKLVRQKSYLGFSSTNLFTGARLKARSLLQVERFFLSLFVVFSLLILGKPVKSVKETVPIYTQARDITIVLDSSSSMSYSNGQRIATAVEVITKFAQERKQDRIALVIFNTRSFLEWPLSLDHNALIYRLSQVAPDGGTVIATGIITGLQHQQQYGQNPGAVIIVSDGASYVIPKDKETIKLAVGNTKIYWVWIGSQTDSMALQFADYITSLGGTVYVGELNEVEQIFAEISKLESSPVIEKKQVTTVPRYGILPELCFLSFVLATLVHIVREI